MEVAKTIEDLRRELKAAKSVVAGDTRYGALAAHFIAERLVTIEALLKSSTFATPKLKRKPSAWMRYFAAGMKAGKTPQQIGAEWKAQKGGA